MYRPSSVPLLAFFFIIILHFCLCLLLLSPLLPSWFCIHTVTITSQQQRCFFCFFLWSLLAWLPAVYGEAVCLLLQCCFTGPAGVTRVRQCGPRTRWFPDSGAPCLGNLPAAGVYGPSWLILSLARLSGSSWAVCVVSLERVSQTYSEVCALTFTLMDSDALQDWGEKEMWNG